MPETYKITVDDQYTFDKSLEEINTLDILKKSKSTYHLIYKDRSLNIDIISINLDDKKIKVKINNKTFNVNINNKLDDLINTMGFTLGANENIDSIQAPMPGLILDIHVKENQEVKEDEPLMILEAMKMENIILSPRDGTIKSIHVNKGAAVNKNELLIEFH